MAELAQRFKRTDSITKKHLKRTDSIFVGDSKFKPYSGLLRKKNSKGSYQTRYFEIRNHYFAYYKSHKKGKLLAGIDLREVESMYLDSLFHIPFRLKLYLTLMENNSHFQRVVKLYIH
jgi:hypothetical protein